MKKLMLLIAVCFFSLGSLFAQNLIVNPGLEDQTPAFWSPLNGTFGTELGVGTDAADVYREFRSFKITKSAVTSGIVGWLSDDNANKYWNNAGTGTFSINAAIKTVGVNTSPANDDARVGVLFEFKNATGTLLSSGTLWAVQAAAGEDWASLSDVVILSEAPEQVFVTLLMGKDATGTVYFDNVGCNTADDWTMGVFNGGAEDVAGWLDWYGGIGNYTMVTDAEAHSGSYSVVMYQDDDLTTYQSELVYYSQPYAIEGGEWYKIGVWVKTEEVNTTGMGEFTYANAENIDGGINLNFFTHGGNIETEWSVPHGDRFIYVDQRDNTTDWRLYEAVHQAKDDATGISVRARFNNWVTGTAWFDDFSVVKMVVVETPYIEPEDEWIIRLFAYSDEFSDNNNYIGTSFDATDGFDIDIDIPEPPPPSNDYLQLYFPHTEWGQAWDNFSKDIRYPFDLMYYQKIWDFSLITDKIGELHTIQVLPQLGIYFDDGIYLKDMSTGDIIQLSSSINTYSFTPPSEGIYNFQIMIGRLYPVQEKTQEFNAGWNMIGLPLSPLTNSVSDLFGGDIAGTSYFYKYAGNTGYEQTEYMYHGVGYWMGLLSNGTLSYIGDSIATTVSVNLINGNNLISNPFKYTICTNNLTFTKQRSTLSYDDAVLNSWISGAIHHWDNNAGGIYISTDTLDIWWGAWMYALTDGVTLNIDPGAIPKGYTTKSNSVGDNDWLVNLQLSSAWSSDVSSGFGMAADASDEFDAQFDYPEPPTSPSGRYLTGYFVHDNWNVLGPKYDRDIRVFANANVTWHYTVKSSRNGNVTLSWEGLNIPENVSLILHDPVMNLDVDMKARTQYDFNYQDDIVFEITKTVMTSIENEDLIPKEYGLAQNYPNPFNPETKIEYQLPKDGRVHLAIYNINGQLVKTLINENYAAGYYAVQFNASELSSGVYLYRIQAASSDGVGANEFTDIKKCMIIK